MITNSETTPFNWQQDRPNPMESMSKQQRASRASLIEHVNHNKWLDDVEMSIELSAESFQASANQIQEYIDKQQSFLNKPEPKSDDSKDFQERKVTIIQYDVNIIFDKISQSCGSISQSVKALAFAVLIIALSAMGYLMYNHIAPSISQ